MGEQSYFHRKFYAGKFKRSKVAPPSREAAVRLALSNGSLQQQQSQCERAMANRLDSDAPKDTRPSHGAPEIRLSGTQSENSHRSLECDEAGPSRAQTGDQEDAREATSPIPVDVKSGRQMRPVTPPNDHIETLNFHPETQSAETSDMSESKRSAKESKLSKATRAILLFRRATSSLNNVDNNGAGCRSSRSFVASFWRQNTADNSALARTSRMSSFASSNNRSHHSLTAFLSGAGGSAAGATGDGSIKDGASLSSFSLPRFIVPKMNALKLPIVCLVKSLDDELMREIFIHRYELGQYLIDNLKVSLGMKDEKYFGLKMADSLEEQEDVRKPWLDLNESVYKQISKHGRLVTRTEPAGQSSPAATAASSATKSVNFYLRIKFYPPNLARVQDQFLKQYLWLQLRRDLRLGKLTSSMNNLTYLMACILQFELGDHKSELVNERLPSMNILPNQDLIEQQAIEIWQQRLVGAKRHLVLMQFLRASVILETYGFDYYPVRDHQRQRAYLLGFNYAGVKTIRNGRIVNHFRWHNLSKISYERRMIIFHIYPNENSKRKQILGFKCLSNDECQNLYLRLLEQKYFFTVDLAYFDKSVRHPTHLQDPFAVGGHHQLAEHPSEWSAGGGGEQAALGGQLGEYFSDEGADLAEDEEENDPSAHMTRSSQQRAPPAAMTEVETTRARAENGPEVDELSMRRMNFQHHRKQAESGGTAVSESTLDSSLEWHAQQSQWQPSASHPLSSCSQAGAAASSYQRQAGVSRRAPLGLATKSDSLQESGQGDPLAYERADCFSQPNSASLEQFTCCAATSGPSTFASPQAQPYLCCAMTPHESSSMASPSTATHHHRNHHHVNQAQLRRQCSFAKYSPDYDYQPDVCLDECNSPPDAEQASSGARMDAYCQQQAGDLAGQPRPGTTATNDKRISGAGQRLVDWTEQFLVQPAALFSRPEDWCALGQPAAAPTQQQSGANGDTLMQIFRLCLLILLLNFLVRLSDGLSSALIDLLSFESTSAAGAKLASIFDGPEES